LNLLSFFAPANLDDHVAEEIEAVLLLKTRIKESGSRENQIIPFNAVEKQSRL